MSDVRVATMASSSPASISSSASLSPEHSNCTLDSAIASMSLAQQSTTPRSTSQSPSYGSNRLSPAQLSHSIISPKLNSRSSNISFLSLSIKEDETEDGSRTKQPQLSPGVKLARGSVLPYSTGIASTLESLNPASTPVMIANPSSNIASQTTPVRRSSSQLNNWPRYYHSHQKRHEHYQQTNSSTGTPGTNSPQGIPIRRISSDNYAGNLHRTSSLTNVTMSEVPESPGLDPTSVSGSPSQFLLTQQTPPSSIPNSLHLSPIISPTGLSVNEATMKSIDIPMNTCGSTSSPNLVPISTPADLPPMTPLQLSHPRMKDNEDQG